MTKSSVIDAKEPGVPKQGDEPLQKPPLRKSDARPLVSKNRKSSSDTLQKDRKQNDLEWAMVEALMRRHNE
jgi:hypothetical protein